jgi:hypothetical protein
MLRYTVLIIFIGSWIVSSPKTSLFSDQTELDSFTPFVSQGYERGDLLCIFM